MRLSAPEKRRGERPVRKGRRAGIVEARRPDVRGCAEAQPFKSPYWPRDEEAAATWRAAGACFWGGFCRCLAKARTGALLQGMLARDWFAEPTSVCYRIL